MNTSFLIGIILCMCSRTISTKNYVRRTNNQGSPLLYVALPCLVGAFFFLISAEFKMSIEAKLIPYTLGYALTYGMSVFFGYKALNCGPITLTSLASSYSLMIPTVYGIVFGGEKPSVYLYIGILFLVFSLFFITYKKGETSKITLRWAIYALLSFAGNGICSTIQRVEQLTFNGGYLNEFMIISLTTTGVILLIVSCKNDKDVLKVSVQKGWLNMIWVGLVTWLTNVFVMLLATRMDASLMFPLISAGIIIVNWIISRLIYKEKLSIMQNLGLVLGIISVVFLNI